MFPSAVQWLIILLIVLLLFGAGKLPKIAGDVAKSIKSFKKGLNEDDTEKDKVIEDKTEDKK